VISLLIGAVVAFVVAVLGTPLVIRVLRARHYGQQIRDDGPFEHPHATKAGTPTMGGVAIVAAVIVGYLVAHLRVNELKFSRTGLTLLLLFVGTAIVGFLDDYLGIRRGRNLGLRKRGKTAGLLTVAAGFALLALFWVNTSTNLSFTRIIDLDLGTKIWFVFAILVVYGSTNAMNLTDGLDGLAAGSGAFVFAAFTIIGFWQFRHPEDYGLAGVGGTANAIDLAVVAAALVGACMGFLWWNSPPAQVFMGDTGSLALGAAMAGLALLNNTVLLLPILGGLYVLETLSVILQIVSFRVFKKRALRMAPLHHHFEVGGWPETTVLVRFWLISSALVGLGIGLFYYDFIRIPGAIE